MFFFERVMFAKTLFPSLAKAVLRFLKTRRCDASECLCQQSCTDAVLDGAVTGSDLMLPGPEPIPNLLGIYTGIDTGTVSIHRSYDASDIAF